MVAFPDGQFTFIDSEPAFKQACEICADSDWLVIDTEFIRTNTFYPKPGLIQLLSGESCFLVDPLAISETQLLADLLVNPAITKIIHACSEDLELFDVYLEAIPESLYDTQIAAAFLGHGMSIGYKNLVQTLFGVELPKDEQRSDWLKRPLTDRQLTYAAADVTYLPEIYKQQTSQLKQASLLQAVLDESAALRSKQLTPQSFSLAYQRIKNAWKLDDAELKVLCNLARWREQQARESDVPRNFLLKDQHLVQLAKQSQLATVELKELEDVRHWVIRKHSQDIHRIIEQAQHADIPVALPQRPLPKSATPLVKELQTKVRGKAEELGIANELLMNRKLMSKIVRELIAGELTEAASLLTPWKQKVIGKELNEWFEAAQAQL